MPSRTASIPWGVVATMKRKPILVMTGLLAVALLRAEAQTSFVWTNMGGGTWSVAGNWTNAVAPLDGGNSDYSLTFPGGTAYAARNDLATTPFVMNQLVTSGTGAAVRVIAGGSLQFTNSSGGAGPAITQTNSGVFTVSNDVDLASSVTLAGSGSGLVTLAGLIGGAGAITKSNSSTFVVTSSTSPSFAGGTLVRGGTLAWRPSTVVTGQFGSGSITVIGGTFGFNGNINGTYMLSNSVLITGAGGTLDFSRNAVSNPNHVFSGTQLLDGPVTWNSAGGGGGSFQADFRGALVLTNADRVVTNNNGGNVPVVVSGSIGQDGTARKLTFVQVSGQPLILSGNNTGLTGGLAVTNTGSGVLRFQSDSALGGGGAGSVAVAPNAYAGLQYAFSPASLAMLGLAPGAILGVDSNSAVAIDLSVTGLNADARVGSSVGATWSGTLTPYGTTYRLGGGGGALVLTGTNALTGARSLAAGGPGPVGGGTLTLMAPNDYSGGTALTNLTLASGATGALGTGAITNNGATLSFANTTQVCSNAIVATNGNASLSASTLVTLTGPLTFGSQMDFSGTSLVILSNGPASGNGNQRITGGAMAFSNVNQLTRGRLELNNGVLVFDVGVGLDWSAFLADRANGYGSTNLQWQFGGNAGQGFAARGGTLTIPATGTTTGTFDRSFTLGAPMAGPAGTLYADGAVVITRDTTLSASADRVWGFAGRNNEVASIPGSGGSTWLVTSPIHEISGKITGGGAGRQLTFNGKGNGNNAAGLGGTIRISNPLNDYVATNVFAKTEGNLVVLVPDDAVLGAPANPVLLTTGGNGPDALLLFEDQAGSGKAFGRSITINTGDASANQSGFGSYAGQVTYTGTVTRIDASGPASGVVYAHPGSRLTLGNASQAVTLAYTGTQSVLAFNKEGGGDLFLSNVVHSAGSRTQKWVLVEGTLATTLDPSQTLNPQGGQLRSAGPAGWIDLVGGSGSTNAKAWAVRGVSQTYSNMAGAGWSGGFTIDVATGLTLRTLTTSALTAQEGAGVDATPVWDMVKTGSGTWVFLNNNTTFISAGRRNNVRIDQGTFDVTGDMGRSGLTLNGGTLLTGSFSPFTDSAGTQRLLIGPGGGKIGLSTAATASVTRASAMAAWDQTMTQTVTFAARDDLNLGFGSAVSNIGANVTLLVGRDGSGTGEVRIANSTWSVAGRLGGNGTLRFTGAGSHVITNTGALSPGLSGSAGTLTLANSDLVLGPSSTLEFDLGAPGASDAVVVNGNLALNGTLNVTPRAGLQSGATYVLMTYTGLLSGAGATIGSFPGSYKGTLTAGDGQVALRVDQTGCLMILQ